MKYMLMALAALFLVSGCASNNTGNYTESPNDRHTEHRISNNLRGNNAALGR